MPAIRNSLLHVLCGLAAALVLSCGDDPAGGGGESDGDSPDSDDSDGRADRGVVCIDNDRDGYGEGCASGFDCNDGSIDSYDGAPELCDGIDNNCDDLIDEGCPCLDGAIRACYSGEEGTAGVGFCLGGFQVCQDEEWSRCMSERLPRDESCDGLDNDCDGETDEQLTNACGTCLAVPEELCGDALDNNCDGRIDEAEAGCDCDDRTRQPCYGGPPQTLGVGACRGGTFDCVDGAWSRCRGQVVPTGEVCDGLDNDCDGRIDEELTNACGDCGAPTPREVCDGEDNDCDGLTDEGLVLACGLCSADGLEEECGDGLDNNCDGNVDEGCPCTGPPSCYPGPPDRRGIGACTEGTRSCDSSGEFWGPCEDFGLPQPEVCDDVDNDCDGLVDISPTGCNVCNVDPETCDGVDNDCDGRVDEFLRNTCGQCLADVTPEETCGPDCCDGQDNDCDGLIDEGLVNACGACDDSCYDDEWSVGQGNLDAGETNGLDEDVSEGLRLGAEPFNYPFLWVANSGASSVTKINTQTATAEATYPVGLSPSRTAVDLDGNVWVANRAFGSQGSVTKIQARDCVGNECVLFTRNIGAVDDIPRGLAIDENNFAWVGTYEGRTLYQLNSATGAIDDSFDVQLRVYGLAIDSESVIWISNLETPVAGVGRLGAFDIEERRLVPGSPWIIPGCSNPYGIAVDGNGHVWLGNWTCDNIAEFNPDTQEFTVHDPGTGVLESVRGIAVDQTGMVWTVASDSDRLGRFDPDMNEWRTFATCGQPMGVGVTSMGTIWTPCWNGAVDYFDALGANLGSVAAGTNPYSYSVMTGFQLRTFTARQGTWTVTFDCGYPVCTFDAVQWDGNLPVGTSVRVQARTSLDLVTWTPRIGPITTNPASLDGLPDGRYLEIEVGLQTTVDDISPLVTSVEVLWQRP